jgi:UDP-N-acetylmuramate: L-alanyl-gamma-D-glutamyl-meso-diaminopimelate ligase
LTVYDDFAHHPTAVRETLKALRAAEPPRGGGRLVAVFEPRSYTSRTGVFQEDFGRAFRAADLVVVAAAHLPGKVPEGRRLSEAELVDALRGQGTEARFIPSVPDIVSALSTELREGDRVVLFSNGAFGGIHEKLLQALERA